MPLAVLAGVICASLGAAPTGIGWWDAVLSFVFGALVTWFSSESGPLTWTIVAAPGLMLAGVPWVIPGVLAFGLVLVGWFRPQPEWRLIGAVVGLMLAPTLLVLRPTWFFGFPSLVVAAVVAVLGVSAWRRMPRREARVVADGVWVLCLVVPVALMLTIPAIVSSVQNVDDAAEHARAGLDRAEAGAIGGAAAEVQSGAELLFDAEESLSSRLTLPAQLIPVASQHLRVARESTRSGAALMNELASVAVGVDLDVFASGEAAIDLDAVRALQPEVQTAAKALNKASASFDGTRSPWLIPPIQESLQEVRNELRVGAETAAVAVDATETIPALLGENEPRRYLMIFGQPAEAREFGGLMSVYGTMTVDNGRLEIEQTSRAAELAIQLPDGMEIEGFPSFIDTADPARWPGNLTSIPDPASLALAADQLISATDGPPIDGVIYMDPFVMEAVLRIVGPLDVPEADLFPGAPATMAADEVVDFLLRDQYGSITGGTARHDYLASLLDVAIDAVAEAELPETTEIVDILGPLVASNRLQVVSLDTDENATLAGLGMQRIFTQQPGEDFLAVLSSNTSLNKLDAYAFRNVSYEATVAPDGSIDALVTVMVESRVDDSVGEFARGFEYQNVQPGEHRTKTIIYTPHEVTGAWVDEMPTAPGATRAFGMNRYTLTEIVRPGETVVFSFSVRGKLDFEARQVPDPELDDYGLQLATPSLVNADDVAVLIKRPAGDRLANFYLIGDTTMRWTDSGSLFRD